MGTIDREERFLHVRTLCDRLVRQRRWEELEALLTHLTFLEDKVGAGLPFELAEDLQAAVTALPAQRPWRTLLRRLQETVRGEATFLARHPDCLFQCLWNACWSTATQSDPAVTAEATRVCGLLARWRAEKEEESPGFVWLRSVRAPPPPRTHSAGMRVQGHSGMTARGVGFLPDRRVCTAGHDGVLAVWDGWTGRLLARGEAEEAHWCIASSLDGRFAATGGSDHAVSLWETDSGQRLARWTSHTDKVSGVAFAPDGTRLASASDDRTVLLWDVVSGQVVRRLTGHGREVVGLAFSPDGEQLASGSSDRTVRVWDARTGQCTATLNGHESLVGAVAYSPDGRTLASASDDGTVRVWSLRDLGAARTLSGHDGWVLAVAFAPDGTLISGGVDGTIRRWDAGAGTLLGLLEGHRGPVAGLMVSPDGRHLASSAWDGTIQVVPCADPPAAVLTPVHQKDIRTLLLEREGGHVASRCPDRIGVWRLSDGECWAGLVGSYDPGYTQISTKDEKSLRVAGYYPVRLVKSPDGTLLVSMHREGQVRLWEAGSRRLLGDLDPGTGGEDRSVFVTFSPDGTLLAGRSRQDCRVLAWEVAGRRLLFAHTLEAEADAIGFSRDGRAVVCWIDGALQAWDSGTGELVAQMHFNPAEPSTIEPDWSWTTRVVGTEMVVVSRAKEEPLAWYPVPFSVLLPCPNRGLVVASRERDLYLLALEGRPPASADGRPVAPV